MQLNRIICTKLERSETKDKHNNDYYNDFLKLKSTSAAQMAEFFEAVIIIIIPE